MKVEIVAAQHAHVDDLLQNLRPRERSICDQIYGPEFERLVRQELEDSLLAYSGLLDGRCGCMWGVKTMGLFADEGILWMIGTTVVDEHPMVFLRHSKRALHSLRNTFKLIYGCVLTDYIQSRRWLEWLGFTIGPDRGGYCRCEIRWG